MTDFINTRLLEIVSYGLQGGPTLRKKKFSLESGRVKRVSLQSMPIYRYRASYDQIPPEYHDVVIAAFIATNGAAFRFKDWADYTFINQTIGTATENGINTFQLIKNYTFGPVTKVRELTKPIESTVRVFVDSIETPATVDELTGIIEVSAATGQVITATGEYDVPVFFWDDDLPFAFENYEAHSTAFTLQEDRFA